jgi:hypothetical protein
MPVAKAKALGENRHAVLKKPRSQRAREPENLECIRGILPANEEVRETKTRLFQRKPQSACCKSRQKSLNTRRLLHLVPENCEKFSRKSLIARNKLPKRPHGIDSACHLLSLKVNITT